MPDDPHRPDATADVVLERLRLEVQASTAVRGTFTGHQVALRSSVRVAMAGFTLDPPGRPVLRAHATDLDGGAGLAGHLDSPTLDPKILIVLGGIAVFTFGVSPVLLAISKGIYDPVNLALLACSAVFLLGIVWIFRLRSFVTRGDQAAILSFLDDAGIRFVDTATPPGDR
jgi:hypothetical protein